MQSKFTYQEAFDGIMDLANGDELETVTEYLKILGVTQSYVTQKDHEVDISPEMLERMLKELHDTSVDELKRRSISRRWNMQLHWHALSLPDVSPDDYDSFIDSIIWAGLDEATLKEAVSIHEYVSRVRYLPNTSREQFLYDCINGAIPNEGIASAYAQYLTELRQIENWEGM